METFRQGKCSQVQFGIEPNEEYVFSHQTSTQKGGGAIYVIIDQEYDVK